MTGSPRKSDNLAGLEYNKKGLQVIENACKPFLLWKLKWVFDC
jgi:hypothetical protein